MTSGRQTAGAPSRWGRGTDGYVRSGQPTAGSLPPVAYVAVNLPLAVSRLDGASLPPVAYVAVNLPLAGLQRSAYRYMSGLQRSAYHYMSTAVSLPLHGLSGLLPLRNTRAVHTWGGKDSVALLRRRPIIRGLVHRLAKSLHHHHVLLVRHPTVAHHVRRRRRRLFAHPAPDW